MAQNLLKDQGSVMQRREGERGLGLREQRRRTRSEEAWFSNHPFTCYWPDRAAVSKTLYAPGRVVMTTDFDSV